MSTEEKEIKSKKRRTATADKEVKKLEEVVFGGNSKFVGHLDVHLQKDSRLRAKKTRTAKYPVESDSGRRKPAWIDEDDYGRELGGKRFANAFNGNLNFNNADQCRWAQRSRSQRSEGNESEEDEADAYVHSTGKYIASKPSKLPPKELQFEHLRDFSTAQLKRCAKNIEFHKRSQVFMAAGFNSRICFYQVSVDGKENPLLHSVRFERCSVKQAHFTVDGQKVLVVPTRHHCLYYYDMPEDKILTAFWPRGFDLPLGEFAVAPDGSLFVFHCSHGRLVLLSSKSCDLIGVLKVDGEIVGSAFSSNSELLYGYSSSGKVYVWNVAAQRCVKIFADHACVTGNSLALSPDDNYIANGCSSGVVNLYKVDSVLSNNSDGLPLKTVMNLTTAVQRMVFNGSSDILAMLSSEKENALKLLHLRSRNVFANFPLEQHHLGYVQDIDFSPNSGYMCLGNSSGNLKLYRLLYYGGY